MALVLLASRQVGSFWVNPNSDNACQSQIISEQVDNIARYSASVDGFETLFFSCISRILEHYQDTYTTQW